MMGPRWFSWPLSMGGMFSEDGMVARVCGARSTRGRSLTGPGLREDRTAGPLASPSRLLMTSSVCNHIA